MPDRSMTVRLTLFILAFAALIIGGAAFFVAVQANGHNAQVAVNDAQQAAVNAAQAHQAADLAAAKAAAAALTAQAAAVKAAAARQDMCTFLDIIRTAPRVDEAREASHLYVVFNCKQVLGGSK